MLSVLMLLALGLDPDSWISINDGVMGGESSGRMVAADQALRFEGELSLENNGGFASVRRALDEGLANATGIELEVRGDGRTYQLRLRQDGRFDGVAWRAEFSTAPEWRVIRLNLGDFEAVFRGRRVAEAGPVLPTELRQIGFMLTDKTPGAFRLDIRAIQFY